MNIERKQDFKHKIEIKYTRLKSKIYKMEKLYSVGNKIYQKGLKKFIRIDG